jgi:hypothetical protein
MLKTLKVRLSGLSIIPHNGQMADPRNSFAKALKAITGKRKKTDSDHEEMARLEFLGSLYTNGHELILPGYLIEAAIIGGAKKSKSGPTAKMAIFADGDGTLDFEGKPDVISEEVLSKLFEDGNHHITVGVKVTTARIMRTRPMFRNWFSDVSLQFEEELVNRAAVLQFLSDSGTQVGLCDWRPKYGRFSTQVLEG